MLKGAALMAWARARVEEWRGNPHVTAMEVLVAEAYLEGGRDALKQETHRILKESEHGR